MIGVTSASLASFGRRPYGRRGCCRTRLPRHRPQPGRPSLHCITPLPDCQAANAGGSDDRFRRRVCGHRDFVGELTTLPWGNRSLLLRDPDGNLVNFFIPLPRPSSESSLADHIPAARQVPAGRSPRIPEIPVPWGDPGRAGHRRRLTPVPGLCLRPEN